MDNHTLAVSALDRAYHSLSRACTDLTLAVLASPDSSLATDACVLAEAIERESAAVRATIVRATRCDGSDDE